MVAVTSCGSHVQEATVVVNLLGVLELLTTTWLIRSSVWKTAHVFCFLQGGKRKVCLKSCFETIFLCISVPVIQGVLLGQFVLCTIVAKINHFCVLD